MAHPPNVSTKIKKHLEERHLWMAASDPKRYSVRQDMSVLLDQFASCRVEPPLQPKPKYGLDDESMCTGLFGYIDVEHMEVSVAVPNNTLIVSLLWSFPNATRSRLLGQTHQAREYSCLSWLLNNSKEYKYDDKSVRCASEAEVKGQVIRDTLSKGGYFVVQSLDTHKLPFLGVKFHDLDPMLKRLYPLWSAVVVQGGSRRSSSLVWF